MSRLATAAGRSRERHVHAVLWTIALAALWIADWKLDGSDRASITPGLATAAGWIYLAMTREVAMPQERRQFRAFWVLRSLSAVTLALALVAGMQRVPGTVLTVVHALFLPVIAVAVTVWWRAPRQSNTGTQT